MTEPPEIERRAAAAGFLLELLDGVPEVVVFVKDRDGRYVAANRTLARRLGRRDPEEIVGRTARELFPAPLGERYLAQDLHVCRTGTAISDLLELHLYPDRSEGWCLTTKVPVRGVDGGIVGSAGTSRDVRPPAVDEGSVEDLAAVLELVRRQYARPLRVADLAATARMSVYQLSRRLRALLGLTPTQLVIKTRIDAARRMLQHSDAGVAEVAAACGYCDQSAFTRQFRSVVGVPPTQYRERHRSR